MKEATFNLYKNYLIGILCGLVITLISTFIAAAAFTALDLSEHASHPIGSVCCAFGCFVGGLISAKISKTKGLLHGAVTGIVIFALFLLAALIIGDSAFTIKTILRLIISLCSGSIGGILGVNRPNKKKMI